ncbi:enoyl-CoA hydratase/isomerase family protein [Blastopirellula marina]|nr:enoyl-CoA hydratase/isomerase family protein [Blastopirellula marina]
MSEPIVLVKKHAPLGTIILNRPEKRNALSKVMIEELEQALRDLHGEKSVRAIVITGAGSAFCSGLDLAEMHAAVGEDDAFERWREDVVRLRDLFEQILRFPKPIIAAVNGPAVAGGAGLVLAADFAIASPEATFGFPEPKRGVISGICAPLLTFRVGGAHAARMLMMAETISAERAAAIGIFQEIQPHEKLWARGMEIAKEIALSADEAIQLTKRMLNETIGETLETFLSAGAAASATSRTTEAAAEGMKAFLEKRDPKWPGS